MTPPNKLPPRPKAASLFMAVPVVFIGAMGLAVAVLYGLTRFGDQTASGDAVAISFSGACLDRATPLLIARAEQVGMPVTMSGSTMSAVLPDIPDAANTIPALLVREGQFALASKDDSVRFDNGHIDAVAIDLNTAGMPITMLKLNAAARAKLKGMTPELELHPEIDGTPFESIKVSQLQETPEITIPSGDGRTSERMKRAADHAIVLEHGPLPCAIHITNVAAANSPG